jgi:hypothetical protein
MAQIKRPARLPYCIRYMDAGLFFFHQIIFSKIKSNSLNNLHNKGK